MASHGTYRKHGRCQRAATAGGLTPRLTPGCRGTGRPPSSALLVPYDEVVPPTYIIAPEEPERPRAEINPKARAVPGLYGIPLKMGCGRHVTDGDPCPPVKGCVGGVRHTEGVRAYPRVMGLWGYGVMGLWGYGVMGLWGYGVMGLRGCVVMGL